MTKIGRKKNNEPWWNKDVGRSQKSQKSKKKQCRRKSKLREYRKISYDQYIDKWNTYPNQQKVTQRKIRDTVAKQKKTIVIETYPDSFA